MSLPSWERGLKLHNLYQSLQSILVAPLVGAWIEIHTNPSPRKNTVSLPSWERGLKCKLKQKAYLANKSLPSWERGLKFVGRFQPVRCNSVAPLVGAWIEIPYAVN